MIIEIKDKSKDMNFIRENLTKLLNCSEKSDWKNCLLTKEKEIEFTEKLSYKLKYFKK
jgi:hypothetical protein